MFQGTYLTFIIGANSYNTSLWTMILEFKGSFLAFGLGLALLNLPLGRARWALLTIAVIACFGNDPRLVAFPIGVAVAVWTTSSRPPRLPLGGVLALAIVGYITACYSDLSSLSRWFSTEFGTPLPQAAVYAAGGAAVLVAVESNAFSARLLNTRVCRLLGRMSFPIYLIHLPILTSAGCWAYLLAGGGNIGVAAASFATLVLTLLVAWPLAEADVWWTRSLDRAVRWLADDRTLPASP